MGYATLPKAAILDWTLANLMTRRADSTIPVGSLPFTLHNSRGCIVVSSSSRWEYKDFTLSWPAGARWWVAIGQNTPYPSETHARHFLWDRLQSQALPAIQQEIDEGWEPVTEIGPAALELRHFRRWTFGWFGKVIFWVLLLSVVLALLALVWIAVFVDSAVEVVGVRIQMRRAIS